MSSVIISSKFQLVVPKEIRERYGFEAGDRVSWFDPGDGVPRIVKFLSFDEMGGMLAGIDLPPFEREKDHDHGERS